MTWYFYVMVGCVQAVMVLATVMLACFGAGQMRRKQPVDALISFLLATVVGTFTVASIYMLFNVCDIATC